MKNWLKKVLSLLIAIALLISAGTLAFADENAEPIESAAAEEAAAQQAAEEAAAAQKAAEEEAAAQKAAEEAAAAQKAAEEAAAAQKAAEEAAAAQKAAEEAAAQQAAEEAAQQAAEETDPIPSYNNNEETPAENQQESSEQEEDDEDEAYDPDDPTIICIDDNDYGHTDPETVEELGLQVTDEIKFPNAVKLSLNEKASSTVDQDNASEYLFTSEYNMAAVLSLNASAEDVTVTINDKAVNFTKTEGTENEAGLKATAEMTLPEGTYHIVLTSSTPVSYTLTIADAYKASAQAEETKEEETAETPDEANNTADTNEENKQEGSEAEGTETGNTDINTDEGTTENEIPVMTGWISVNSETYTIGDVITLKAESDAELGDMVLWQTKVRNEEGEDAWQSLGYGATIDIELTEENSGATYRFKMEYDNYSEEFTLVSGTEDVNAEENTEETEETEQPEEAEENEETETTEETEEDKMAALGYTRVIVTTEEGADLYAEADRESEVTGHLDAETKIWVTLDEEKNWGGLYSEDEEASAQFISMEDAEIISAEEMEAETEEALIDDKLIELGYRKVQVLNKNGVDVYASIEEEAEAIDHIDFGKELWIKDAEIEGWAETHTEEEEESRFIKLNELDKQPLTDEELLALGYYKVMVILEVGNDVYLAPDENSEIIDTLPAGTELWVMPLENNWANIYSEDEEEDEQFIYLVDMLALMTPEDAPELPIRSLILSLNIPERGFFFYDEEVIITAELIDFLENDVYDIQWLYSSDEGETFIEIEDAHDLTYSYTMDEENEEYIYRIVITLLPKDLAIE